MKFKMIRTVLAVGVFALSCIVNTSYAGLITNNGYEHEVGSNIISDGALEWYRWDVSKGKAYDSAITDLGLDANEWQLANIDQMSDLFENFFAIAAGSYSDTANVHITTTDALVTSFQSMFGTTFTNSSSINFTRAYFAGEATELYSKVQLKPLSYKPDGDVNAARVDIDIMNKEIVGFSYNGTMGVALVRVIDLTDESVTQVPEPSTMAIFSLALIALFSRRIKRS